MVASLAALALAGCVHVYHPMTGLHDPVVVNPQLPNFDDVALTVRCIRGDISAEDNGKLCRNVGQLFETQGARVKIVESIGDEEDFGEEPDEAPAEEGAPVEPPTDLVLELRSRIVHRRISPWSAVFCVGSFTVLPAAMEQTFAQEITIRDATGFLLVTDTLQGRIVSRFGAGTWLFNRLGDLGRDREDRLTTKVMKDDLSKDLYRQLSQRLFDAKLQWRVMQETHRVARPTGAP